MCISFILTVVFSQELIKLEDELSTTLLTISLKVPNEPLRLKVEEYHQVF